MSHQARVELSKSDAMVYGSNLDQPAAYKTAERTLIIPLPDGPWVQFTYDWATFQGDGTPPVCFMDGYWMTTDDNELWSDMVISIEPVDSNEKG